MVDRDEHLVREFIKESLVEARIKRHHPEWVKLTRWFKENILGLGWGGQEEAILGTRNVIGNFVNGVNKSRKKMMSREQEEKIYEYAKKVLETEKRSGALDKKKIEEKLLFLLEKKFGDLRYGAE